MQGGEEHGAQPSTQPLVEETKVTDCGRKPGGTGPSGGPGATPAAIGSVVDGEVELERVGATGVDVVAAAALSEPVVTLPAEEARPEPPRNAKATAAPTIRTVTAARATMRRFTGLMLMRPCNASFAAT